MNNFFTIAGIIVVGFVLVAFSPNESKYKEHSMEVKLNDRSKIWLKKIKLDGTICVVAQNGPHPTSVALSCDWGK